MFYKKSNIFIFLNQFFKASVILELIKNFFGYFVKKYIIFVKNFERKLNMNVIYQNETFKYDNNFRGEPVLWITNPSQIDLENVTFVGEYPGGYCIFTKDLSENEQLMIRAQVKQQIAVAKGIKTSSKRSLVDKIKNR